MLTGEGAVGNGGVNTGRRRFLVAATSVVGAAGAVVSVGVVVSVVVGAAAFASA